MLLTESDRARMIRSRILDIVIEVVAERSGGHTKYINQLDKNNLNPSIEEVPRHKVLTHNYSQFDKFLVEASRSLEQKLADPELLSVFKRLKDR